MKQTQSITKLLGLTQEQLALILKVSRMQISRYELGLGTLPLGAMQRLAPIVEHLLGSAPEINAPMLKEQNNKMKLHVAKMLKENEYQLAFTARLLEQAERKHEAKVKALQVVKFLSAREELKNENDDAILHSISHKASKSLKSNGLDLLFSLKVKLEMLELEKRILEAEVQKH